MVFSIYIITDPTQTKISPKITILPVRRGIIHHWHLFFPYDNLGGLNVQVYHGDAIILPSNQDGQINGYDMVFSGDDFYPIITEPYALKIVTWNSSGQSSFAVSINIFIKGIWTFYPMSDKFLELLAEAGEL